MLRCVFTRISLFPAYVVIKKVLVPHSIFMAQKLWAAGELVSTSQQLSLGTAVHAAWLLYTRWWVGFGQHVTIPAKMHMALEFWEPPRAPFLWTSTSREQSKARALGRRPPGWGQGATHRRF